MLFRQFFRLANHAGAALGRGRQDDLGAETTHDHAALDRKRVGHCRDKRMTRRRAHHRECDARIA